MMNANRSLPTSGETGSGRLWLKLVGLFALSFVGFFVIFAAYDVLTAFGQDRASEQPVNNLQSASIVIDPKIEAELTKVLASDPTADAGDIKDPFIDRAGLSGAVLSSAGVVQNAAGPAGSNAAASTTVPGVVSGKPGTAVSNPPVVSAIEATKLRYASWIERYGVTGEVPLDPRIFAIEDLLPVGIVDGGNGQQEVMFFSEAAGKTFSFPLGTVFFDGWLTELRPEGVVFSSSDNRRTVRMRSWARSFKNVG